MKYYRLTGYVIPKGQEDKGWQKIGEGAKIKLGDNENPYDIISQNFKLAASHWMFCADEITEGEARKE